MVLFYQPIITILTSRKAIIFNFQRIRVAHVFSFRKRSLLSYISDSITHVTLDDVNINFDYEKHICRHRIKLVYNHTFPHL